MKKLMIAAAAAAMVGGAFAEANSYEPQVYDMTITLKTSVCNDKGALSASICEDTIVYRDQKTVKLQGLFWGCGCNVIACPEAFTTYENDGYVFWFPTTKLPWTGDTSFEWSVLNLIGKKADKVEGAWTLTLGEYAELNGAGFGTAKFYDCGSEYNYIKSMNGSVVGGLAINELGKGWIGCKYCGEEVECGAWAFCACVDNTDTSASSGTWTLKYNSSLTKALANGKYITDAAKSKLPKAVLEYLLAGNDDPVEPDTPAQKAEKAYKTAVNVYTTAIEGKALTKAEYDQAFANSTTGQMNTAIWINGTNETAKAEKELVDARKAFKDLLADPNYAELLTVTTECETYWAAAQKYLRFKADVAINAPDPDGDEHTAKEWQDKLDELKKKMDDAKIALENALAKVETGATVKANATAALDKCYEKAEAFFNVAVKYVMLDDTDTPDYNTIAWWTQKQLDDATTTAFNADDEQGEILKAAKADMDTKRSICQALGGDCE